ncbi:hypothetical protein ACIBHX_03750 [Nonomuraea sp. NPDC050536]|uniref:hypothetical protein n=1 Tax=Nonomuraea sp. NPDC050536 TaxID=3364366 RepID=UPI0037CC9790
MKSLTAAVLLATLVSGHGGEPESFTFTTTAPSVRLEMRCTAGQHALAWLNGALVISARCPRAVYAGTARRGVNRVVAAVVRARSAGTGELTSLEADELLAWSVPYPSRWSITVFR